MSREEQFKEIFDLYDRNGDGTIETVDISHVLRALRWDATQRQLLVITKEVDSQDTGYVSYDDLWRVAQTRPADEEQEEQLRKAFLRFDTYNTGEIEVQELKSILTEMGDVLTSHEVDDILLEADSEINGKVDYEKLIHYLRGESLHQI